MSPSAGPLKRARKKRESAIASVPLQQLKQVPGAATLVPLVQQWGIRGIGGTYLFHHRYAVLCVLHDPSQSLNRSWPNTLGALLTVPPKGRLVVLHFCFRSSRRNTLNLNRLGLVDKRGHHRFTHARTLVPDGFADLPLCFPSLDLSASANENPTVFPLLSRAPFLPTCLGTL